MRRTKIIATVGPKTENLEILEEMASSGVDIFRLNFSHGDHKWHGKVIDRIQKLNKKLDQPRAIMLDTKGPEIRTGDLKVPLVLRKGKKIILTVDHQDYEAKGKISVNYDAFIHDVEVDDKILVDNGNMTLIVEEKKGPDVICKVLDGGTLTSRRHLNLPGKDVSLESITSKDWEDILFGIKKGVDFIALSFVRSADEIRLVRDFLMKKKAGHIGIIAKVETLDAIEHIGSIFEASDGIMVARGDLGAEIPFTQVPLRQWEIAQMAARYGKPTIVATQMLESMTNSPMPTRAEVSDVFAGVWQRNDAVMLSGETATGKFPIKSIEAMRDIAIETENAYLKKRSIRKVEPDGEKSEFCKNAGNAAEDLPDISAIVVVTRTGNVAQIMANFRPQVPIFAVTNNDEVLRKLQILWGTKGFKITFSRDPEKTIQNAIKEIHKVYTGSIHLKKKKFVLLSDILVGKKFEPALQIREF